MPVALKRLCRIFASADADNTAALAILFSGKSFVHANISTSLFRLKQFCIKQMSSVAIDERSHFLMLYKCPPLLLALLSEKHSQLQ
jgi:hypothetical protein